MSIPASDFERLRPVFPARAMTACRGASNHGL